MQYFGGKERIASQIAPFLSGEAHYIEPFVGGGSVLCRVTAPRRVACDANAALIYMWKALQRGWEPPLAISETEYEAAKMLPDDDPLKAFIGFGCSFSGKWFGGYARGAIGRNYASSARNGLLKKISTLSDVEFGHGDYRSLDYYRGCVVYCDPPYKGTTQYGATGKFNWIQFWDFMSDVSRNGCAVFVSEYSAPDDWSPIVEIETRTDIRTRENGKETRTERLFCRSTNSR